MSERMLFSGLRDKLLNAPNPKMGIGVYIIAALSFIPVLGMLFGIAALTLGLCTKRKGRFKVMGIGFAGILFTLGLNLYLSNYAFNDSENNAFIRGKLTQLTLNAVLENLETHKAQFEQYPDSIEELTKKNIATFIHDPMDIQGGFNPRYLYYKKADADHYYLLSIGLDGVAFTKDDIVPEMKTFSQKQSGLLIQPGN